MTPGDLRDVLRKLDGAALAALLHELGFELYRREIARWRVLSDIADELMDQATFDARAKLTRVVTTATRSARRARRSRRLRAAS